MSNEDQVLEHLGDGLSPAEVMSALRLRRDQYYMAVDSLKRLGVLSNLGDLPDGASTEVCPTEETNALVVSAFDTLGWSKRILSSIRSLSTRYGWMKPLAPDDRYNRSQWTGQAVRRVDFEHDGTGYMVVGYLIPRVDKLVWERATPQHRLVYIESSALHNPISWRMNRGRIVKADVVDTLVSASGRRDNHTSPELRVALTLACAWVNESIAILTTTLPVQPGRVFVGEDVGDTEYVPDEGTE